MLLVDANVLLYAVNPADPHRDAARAWLDEALGGTAKVGFAWVALLTFVRLAGHPRVFRTPATHSDAWATVRRWLSSPVAWIPAPTERHPDLLGECLRVTSRPGDVNDAHLAALALEHGLVLCTADRGFARFEHLRWHNPIAT